MDVDRRAPWYVTDECVWPERRGLVAYIVKPTPDEARIYPFHGLGAREVVVWIDDDPLSKRYRDYGWTCVLDGSHLSAVSPA